MVTINTGYEGREECVVRMTLLLNKIGSNILPVVEISVSLGELGGEVDRMAGEEEVVSGRDGESVAHEGSRVDGQSTSHLSRDAV